jgi:hypothetical protein
MFEEPPVLWGVTNEAPGNIYGIYYADVTGDGKADFIEVDKNGIWVEPSGGQSFVSSEKWSDIGYIGNVPIGYYVPQGDIDPLDFIAFADVDGDGKADAIVVNKGGGITVRRCGRPGKP